MSSRRRKKMVGNPTIPGRGEHAHGVVSTMGNPLSRFTRPQTQTDRLAVVADTVVARAGDTQRVDGYEYFAPESVNWDLLEPSDHTSVCPWKGIASYYDVVVDGKRYPAAAWSYRDPSVAARHIAGHVAFWRGVRVVKG